MYFHTILLAVCLSLASSAPFPTNDILPADSIESATVNQDATSLPVPTNYALPASGNQDAAAKITSAGILTSNTEAEYDSNALSTAEETRPQENDSEKGVGRMRPRFEDAVNTECPICQEAPITPVVYFALKNLDPPLQT
jgi:hypothetical protein